MYENLSPEALEKCIKRMSHTLRAKPRSQKTRKYLMTLTGEPETPAQLRRRAKMAVRASAVQVAREVIARLQDAQDVVRRDRIRPRARPIEYKAEFEKSETKFCRPSKRQNVGFLGRRKLCREPRDMNETAKLRSSLYEAQNGLCGICEHYSKALYMNLDHVTPRDVGGDDEGNLVMAHRECNQDKANDMPTGCERVFLMAVNARIGVPDCE